MISRILVANRGEIACRIIKTCRRMGIGSAAVFSEADAQARHVQLADEALFIGPSPAAQSYLSIEAILNAAQRAGVDAIHPGYGFLAENADFAHACQSQGIIFIGPTAEAISAMGDKRTARQIAEKAHLPLIPGYNGEDQTDDCLAREAAKIGYPLLVKAAAGGGGRGMRLVEEESQLLEALAQARNEALKAFGSAGLLLEKAIGQARHVEVQILADGQGNILHLGERDCSAQRRFQKVIEETPSPAITPSLGRKMAAAAVDLARAAGYQSAGTVEFLYGPRDQFYFLEMNTRLQVEHPVTEMVSGIDLVAWQIRIAGGEKLSFGQEDIQIRGHAIEARVYAENPARDFLPVTGDILLWQPPKGEGIRVDSGLKKQDRVSAYYDPLLAKVIAHGADREIALRRLIRALEETILLGLVNNRAFLIDLLRQENFQSGAYHTRFIASHFQDWQAPGEETPAALFAAALARYQQDSALGQGYWRNNPNQLPYLPFFLPESASHVGVRLVPDPWQPNQFEGSLSHAADRLYVLQYHQLANNSLQFSIDGQWQTFNLANKEDHWWVHSRQSTTHLQALPLLPKAEPRAGSGGSLRAPMPGSVLAVLVEVGQEVAGGQALIKLEAMKMEHTIRSAAPGRVEAIYYKAGDNVEADAQLLKIGPL